MDRVMSGKDEQQEDESTANMSEFLENALPMVSVEGFEPKQIPRHRLLQLYVHMMNKTSADVAGFAEYLRMLCGKDVPVDDWQNNEMMARAFKQFLWEKLPTELQKRQEEIAMERQEQEIPTERLLKLHERRKQSGDASIVGFHVGPFQKSGKVYFGQGVHEVRAGDAQAEMSGGAFYATDPEHLYGQKNGALYIVEGSRKHLETPYARSKEKQKWAAAQGNLPVLNDGEPIPITDELVKEFNLRFEQ